MKYAHFVGSLGVGIVSVGSVWGQSSAGCDNWTQVLAPAGANGPVNVMATWDPDGPGPQPEWLVIAGQFTSVGGVVTGAVAGWDGTTWHAMGRTVRNVGTEGRLIAVGTDLVLVGSGTFGAAGFATAFRYADGDFVAMDGPEGTVADAASSGSELVMVGLFTPRAGKNGATIARWRPETGWTHFGGVPYSNSVVFHSGAWYIAGRPILDGVNVPAVMVGDGNGGWTPLTPLSEQTFVSAPSQLLTADGSLWAIGALLEPNGTGDAVRFESGAWVQRGEGVGEGVVPGRAFVTGGELYREVTTGTGYSLIRHNAGSWAGVPGRLESRAAGGALYDGQLHAAALIDGSATPAVSIPGEWRAMGSGFVGTPGVGSSFVGGPTQVTTWRGHAVVGGAIAYLDHQHAGGLIERGPNGWTCLAAPLAWPEGGYVEVRAIASHNDELIACGDFVSGGGVPLERIAAWNGVTWRSLGAGLPIAPTALASEGGVLYAAGRPPSGSGYVTVWRRVSEQWEQVGGSSPSAAARDQEAIGVHNGEIVLSSFYSLNRSPSGGLYYRFDGSDWSIGPTGGAWRMGTFAVLGDSLMVSATGGDSPVNAITPQGLVPRSVGPYWVSGSFTPYIFNYRGGLLFSARFLNSQERAAFVPVQGDITAMANPGGVVTAFAENGVDGYGLVNLELLAQPVAVVVSRISCSCGAADMGSAGGIVGADGALNNNDFVAFIGLFFASDSRADLGMAGGHAGSDGQFNNNDFIAFINAFFTGCEG